jgi:hypothetical protein
MISFIALLLIALLYSTNAFAPQMTFNGNSKLMLEKVLEGSPFLFRNKIRSKILNQLGNGHVSENDLIEALKQTTPPMFLSSALDTAMRYQSEEAEPDL